MAYIMVNLLIARFCAKRSFRSNHPHIGTPSINHETHLLSRCANVGHRSITGYIVQNGLVDIVSFRELPGHFRYASLCYIENDRSIGGRDQGRQRHERSCEI